MTDQYLGPTVSGNEVLSELRRRRSKEVYHTADPVADIAILGEPDGQVLYEHWEAFDSFIEKTTPLPISGRQSTRGYVLALTEPSEWIEVSLTTHPKSVSITERVESGMSGSPILDAEWRAVAIISTDSINPRLGTCLPGWAIEAFRVEMPLCAKPRP